MTRINKSQFSPSDNNSVMPPPIISITLDNRNSVSKVTSIPCDDISIHENYDVI